MWLRLNEHPSFTVLMDGGRWLLYHWHDEDVHPTCHLVERYRADRHGMSLSVLEFAAGLHLAGHGPEQEDDSEPEPPVLYAMG